MKLVLESIYKKYENKVVFSNLNISLLSAGIYILKGSNGVGKSTLLNIISFDDPSFKGKIYFNDTQIKGSLIKDYKLNVISYSHQINYFLTDKTLLENIKALFENKSEEEIDELLKVANLYNSKNILFEDLSDGEKNRTSIVCTLLKANPIIIFDESFTYLDHKIANDILSYIKSKLSDKIVIISTHEELNYLNLADFKIIDLNELVNGNDIDSSYSYDSNLKTQDIKFKSSKKQKYVKSFLKENKFNVIFTSIFNFIFTALLIFNSFLSSFTNQNSTYLNNSYIKNNFSVAQFNDYQNIDNSYSVERFFNQNEKLNEINSLISSPIFYCSEIKPYKIIHGEEPKNSNELLISSINYDLLIKQNIIQDINSLTNLKFFNDLKFVGVYESSNDFISKDLIKLYEKQESLRQFEAPELSFMRYASFGVISKETMQENIDSNKNIYIDIRNISFNELKDKRANYQYIYFKNKDVSIRVDELITSLNNITLYLNFAYILLLIIINVLSISLFYTYSRKRIAYLRINGASKNDVLKIIFSFFGIMFGTSLIALITFASSSQTIIKLLTSSLTYSSGFNFFSFNILNVYFYGGVFLIILGLMLIQFRKLLRNNMTTFYIEEKEKF